jgi:predicted phosphodiesterase
MRYGIFGDIHSNLEALEAVIEDMQAQDVTNMVCIGDIVGYNASPRESLEIVRSLGCPVVKGNHDEEASELREVEHFNDLALASIKYSRQQLTKDQKEYLRALPFVRPIEHFTVVHSSLDQPERWTYVFSQTEAEASFSHQKANICFFGHTHVPNVFIRDSKIHQYNYTKFEVQPEKRYFVNVGSVGQPRDGDWRAAYVIYDTEANTVLLRRVPYDIAKAQAKIMNAGLPPRLAERLANAV